MAQHHIGVSSDYYQEVPDAKLTLEDFSFEWIESKHSDKIRSFGLLLKFKKQTIYYSGDSSIIPAKIHQAFLKNEIERIYQDLTIESENTSHLTLEEAKS